MAQAGAQQGGFAHAARSPQQHVMRGVAMGMAQHIVDHLGLLLVHAVDQVERGGLDGGHGARLDAVPHIGGGGGPVDGGGGGGGNALQRGNDALDLGSELIAHGSLFAAGAFTLQIRERRGSLSLELAMPVPIAMR
jgi:hypothetical protein